MWPNDKSLDAQSSSIRTIFPDTPPNGIIYDCPHAGRTYPADFRFSCPKSLLERAEDTAVDRLIANAPAYGIPLLGCEVARTYVDLNRRPDEIDPSMMCAPWKGDMELTPHVQAGVGLVRKLLTPTIPVYRRQLTPEEIQARIDNVYTPYHAQLAAVMNKTRKKCGFAFLIDWHSMPGKLPTRSGYPVTMPDIVIGDLHGKACAKEFSEPVGEFFRQLGYSVAFNDPYSGQEIVRRWGRPNEGFHAIQIEISKALYLEETSNRLNGGFKKLKANLDQFHEFMAGLAKQSSLPLAAD